MKKYYNLVLFTICCASVLTAKAQKANQIYFPKNDIRVIGTSGVMTAAWCGGLDIPQFAMADLNKDGKQDLVIFDEIDISVNTGIRTFINTGTAGTPIYVYEPSYEDGFPTNIRGWAKLEDYNRDGVPDLFHIGIAGFDSYTGFYDNNRLIFRKYKDLRYADKNGTTNAYCLPGDIPIIHDIDGDGDLDFISYNLWGTQVDLYKNCQVEEGLPKDSIKICYADECWGKFYQNYERTIALARSCDNTFTTCNKGENKGTHQGNTLCLVSIDGDADFDVLNGNISFSDIQLLINGKTDYSYAKDTMVAQDTIWGTDGHDAVVDMFPAAFNIDIDQDGAKDIIVSPHAETFENYRSVLFYKNTGTNQVPQFSFQTDAYFMDQMIDLGGYSRPVFFDYNRDGKVDLFVGSEGYYQRGGKFITKISYYENVSDPGYPTFKLITSDFQNLSKDTLKGASIAFGDIDNDGKDDMVIGQTDGTILLYKNTAASGTAQPQWLAGTGTLLKTKTGVVINVVERAAPFIYDIDSDGKKDLICGSMNGKLYYYKTDSNASAGTALTYITDKLGGAQLLRSTGSGYSVPYIGPIDNTKKEYLVVGSVWGDLYVYDGLRDTTGVYKLVDSNYQQIRHSRSATPAFTDIDADGKYELLVGNEKGGVHLYRQLFSVGIHSPFEKPQLTIYPNPAKHEINLKLLQAFADADIEIKIVNTTGQTVYAQTIRNSQYDIRIATDNLPAGMYYCVVQSAGNRVIAPVTIVK